MMSFWLIWCAIAGLVLGAGLPAAALMVFSVLAALSGLIAHWPIGIGEAVVATSAGLVVLQLSFMAMALTAALLRGGVARPGATILPS